MTTDYINYLPLILFQLPHVLIFALWVAATLAAGRRARGHLAWLVLTTTGWGFGILSGVVNIAFLASARNSGFHSQPASLLLIGQQVLGGFGTLCFLVGGVLLLLRFLAPQERVS